MEMKIIFKKTIAKAMAAVTLAIPFSCITSSAASIPDSNSNVITSMNYYTPIMNRHFKAYSYAADTSLVFYCDGSTLYAAFGNTDYGTATVKFNSVNYGYTGDNFYMSSGYTPTQYVPFHPVYGPGNYKCITSTTNYAAEGDYSVGHY